MSMTIPSIAARLGSFVEALAPAADVLAAQRARAATTEDGRPRLDRGVGMLPDGIVPAIDASGVFSTPTTVSLSGNLETQVDDLSEALVSGALAVGDTTSVELEVIDVGGVLTIFAETTMEVLSGSTTVDVGSIAAGAIAGITITVTGAVAGDCVAIGAPGGLEDDLLWSGRVISDDTVIVRLLNTTGSAIDPGSATWKAKVLR